MANMSDMEVEPPFLPPAAVQFAKDMATLAKQHGIRECTTTMWLARPSGGTSNVQFDGKLIMHYSGFDRRGRPCENVYIEADSRCRINVVQTPES